MNITHLWQDYSPNLFDRAHPLCLAHGHVSEVVCQAFIDNGAAALPHTHWVRRRDPAESNSMALPARLLRRLRRPLDLVGFARLVQARVQAAAPQVLHLHFGTTAAALVQRGALPRLPMVVSFYGVDVSQSLRDAATLQAYGTVFQRATLLHVLCDEARQRLVDAGCAPAKIRVANLPINLDAIPDIGVTATPTTRFLIPARFVEKKGHKLLLDAMRQLLDDGLPVQLTCFGYGPTEWLVHAVAERGLGDAVRVVNNQQSGNFIADYVQMLQTHDVVLAPSIRASNGDDEGGPALTLVMAQAAGKAVIVSDFPGAERSVDNGREGLVVPAGQAHALAAAMRSLVGGHARWQRMGRLGRQRAVAEFSEAAYWQQLQDWYRACAAAAP